MDFFCVRRAEGTYRGGRQFFQVILTTKIDFFDVEKFRNFVDLGQKTVTPRGSGACKNFCIRLASMMWALKIFSNIRAFKHT